MTADVLDYVLSALAVLLGVAVVVLARALDLATRRPADTRPRKRTGRSGRGPARTPNQVVVAEVLAAPVRPQQPAPAWNTPTQPVAEVRVKRVAQHAHRTTQARGVGNVA